MFKGLFQVLRDVKIPTTGGASVVDECEEGLEAARVHIAEVSRILKEGPSGLAADEQPWQEE